MLDDFVDALTELRVFVRKKLGANSDIARPPALATIVRSVDAAGGHRDQHSSRILWIEDNRVQTEAPTARLPHGLVLMVEQTEIWRPILTAVARLEERCGLDAGVEHVRL